jgi:hypothetical protein
MNSIITRFMLILFSLCTTAHTMEKTQVMIQAQKINQLAIIHPFFKNTQSIKVIRKTMDNIEEKNLEYPDYASRKGMIWSDLTVRKNNFACLTEHFNTTKLTMIDDVVEKRNPQKVVFYPKVRNIIIEQLLPAMFSTIEKRKWATIPKKVFAQLYIQRCHTSKPMGWHQDPGEDFTVMADYSLIVMLSDQNDKEHGWNGGVLRIKPTSYFEECPEEDVETVIHAYNQGVLFNNKENSHEVSEVITQLAETKRDILVLMIYFGEIPIPTNENLR